MKVSQPHTVAFENFPQNSGHCTRNLDPTGPQNLLRRSGLQAPTRGQGIEKQILSSRVLGLASQRESHTHTPQDAGTSNSHRHV